MADVSDTRSTDFADLTGDIVAAYVSDNSVRPTGLPDLIRNVYGARAGLADGTAKATAAPKIEKLTAAQIRKSVTPDGIVSFLMARPTGP